jgi:uncharacterized protein (TIGR02611 family)
MTQEPPAEEPSQSGAPGDGGPPPDPPGGQADDWSLPWSVRNPGVRDMAPRLERFGGRTEDFVDSVESAIGKAVPHRVSLLGSARHNTVVNVLWRAGVLVVGLFLVSAGVVMLVIPGPGWGAIILGLVVLASEYAWANRLLGPVRAKAKAAAARARRLTRRQQVVALAVLAVFGAAAAATLWWYMDRFGLQMPWS